MGPVPAEALSEPDSVLSEHERALLGPRAVPKRREDFLRGRWTAKKLLTTAVPGSTQQDYVILPDSFGAPFVHDRALSRLPWSISISHTDQLAMAALCESPGRIGVDVERPIGEPSPIIREYFTAAEVELCRPLQGPALFARVALIWSVKEALMKLVGQGLRIPPTAVGLLGVEPGTGQWNAAEVFLAGPDIDTSLRARVWVRERSDWVAALAVADVDQADMPDMFELR